MVGPRVRRTSVQSLDTNVLLRWLLADVPDQAARVDALLDAGERCTIDDTALIETVFVLERVMLLSRSAVADAIRTVLSTAAYDVERSRWSAVMDAYLERPRLSVTDLYLAERARESGATPLYTFDKKLASQQNGVELL